MAEQRDNMELNLDSDLKDVLNVLECAKTKWFLIGVQLGISVDKLNGFHGKDDPHLLMIMEWFNCDSLPTKAALVKALRSRSVGLKRLAGEIERSTLGQHTTPTTGEEVTSTVHAAEESGRSTLEQRPPSRSSGYSSAVETSDTPTSTLSDDNGPTLETQDSFASEASNSYSKGTFPHLKTDMSQQDRATLETILITDSQKIQKLFGDLVNATKSSLEKHSCVKKIKSFLSEYNFLAVKKSASKKLLQECLPELAAAETVIDIFTVIHHFYSFFHFDLIATIIEKCCAGNDDLKEQLKIYESEFKEFCKRKARECPAGTFGTEGEPEENEIHLVVKTKGDFEAFTLEAENIFRLKLCKCFGVKPSALRFIDASEGCIRLVFSLPSFLEEAIFPLSDQQKESLRGEGVMLLRSNQTEQFCDREELETHDTLCLDKPTGEMAQPTVDLDSQSTTEDLSGSTGDSIVRSKEAEASPSDSPATPTTLPDSGGNQLPLLKEALEDLSGSAGDSILRIKEAETSPRDSPATPTTPPDSGGDQLSRPNGVLKRRCLTLEDGRPHEFRANKLLLLDIPGLCEDRSGSTGDSIVHSKEAETSPRDSPATLCLSAYINGLRKRLEDLSGSTGDSILRSKEAETSPRDSPATPTTPPNSGGDQLSRPNGVLKRRCSALEDGRPHEFRANRLFRWDSPGFCEDLSGSTGDSILRSKEAETSPRDSPATPTTPPDSGGNQQSLFSSSQIERTKRPTPSIAESSTMIGCKFKRMVHSIANRLSEEDCRMIKFIEILPNFGETSALQVLDLLERRGIFSQDNIEPLETLMKDIDRTDIITHCIAPYLRESKASQRKVLASILLSGNEDSCVITALELPMASRGHLEMAMQPVSSDSEDLNSPGKSIGEDGHSRKFRVNTQQHTVRCLMNSRDKSIGEDGLPRALRTNTPLITHTPLISLTLLQVPKWALTVTPQSIEALNHILERNRISLHVFHKDGRGICVWTLLSNTQATDDLKTAEGAALIQNLRSWCGDCEDICICVLDSPGLCEGSQSSNSFQRSN